MLRSKPDDRQLYTEIRELILRDISENNNLNDRELLESIDYVLDDKSAEYGIGLKEKLKLKNRLFNSFRKLDVLQELLDNKAVTEIMINSADEIFVEINNHMERRELNFENQDRLEDIIQQIVSRIN